MKIVLFMLLSTMFSYGYEYSAAVNDLLKNNNSIKSSRYDLKADKSEYLRSYSSFLPSLSLQQTYSKMDENSASKYDISSLLSSIPGAGATSKTTSTSSTAFHQTQFVIQENISAQQIANISMQSHNYNISKLNMKNNISKNVSDFTSILYDYYIAMYNDSLLHYKTKKAEFLKIKNNILLKNSAITDIENRNSIIELNSSIVEKMDNDKKIEVLRHQITELIKNNSIPDLIDAKNFFSLGIDSNYNNISGNIENSLLYNINLEAYELKKSSFWASFGNFVPSASLSYSWGHKQDDTFDPFDESKIWSFRINVNWSLVNFSNLILIKTAYNQYQSQYYKIENQKNEISRQVYNLSKSISYFKKQYKILTNNLNLSKQNINIAMQRYKLNEIDEYVLNSQLETYYTMMISYLNVEKNLVSLCFSYYTINNQIKKIFEKLNIKENI